MTINLLFEEWKYNEPIACKFRAPKLTLIPVKLSLINEQAILNMGFQLYLQAAQGCPIFFNRLWRVRGEKRVQKTLLKWIWRNQSWGVFFGVNLRKWGTWWPAKYVTCRWRGKINSFGCLTVSISSTSVSLVSIIMSFIRSKFSRKFDVLVNSALHSSIWSHNFLNNSLQMFSAIIVDCTSST